MYDYTNRDVPYIKDHSDALRIYESITPLKSGPCKGKRPVGARRKTYQCIWLAPDGAVKVSVGWRDHTNCEVSFYRTGLITVAWPTGQLHGSTGMGFVSALLGIEINCRGNRPWIHGVVALRPREKGDPWSSERRRIYGSFPMQRGALTRLQREEAYPNELTLLDPIFPTVRTINKQGARELRKQYASFISYAKGLYALQDHAFTDSQYQDEGIITYTREDIPKLMLSDEPSDNLHAAMGIITYTREDIPKLMLSDEPSDNLHAAMWLAQANKSRRHFWDSNEVRWQKTSKRALADISTTIFGAHPTQAYAWEKRYDGEVYRGPIMLIGK